MECKLMSGLGGAIMACLADRASDERVNHHDQVVLAHLTSFHSVVGPEVQCKLMDSSQLE